MMMRFFGLCLFSFFLPLFSTDIFANTCLAEAQRHFKIIQDVLILDRYEQVVEPSFKAIKRMYKEEQCFNFDDLSFNSSSLRSNTDQYFDRETGEPLEYLKEYNQERWRKKRDLLIIQSRTIKKPKFLAKKKALMDSLTENGQEQSGVFSVIEHLEHQKTSQRAASCTNKDEIRDKLPEIRDQGNSRWCTQHTYADLLSVATGMHISATYLGNLLSPEGGGIGNKAINLLVKNHGLCSEKLMRSTEHPQVKGHFDIDAFETRISRLADNGLDFKNCPKRSELKKLFANLSDDKLGSALRQAFHPIPDFARTSSGSKNVIKTNYIEDYESSDPGQKFLAEDRIMSHIILAACESDRKKTKGRNIEIDSMSTLFSSSLQILDKIDNLIDAGKPVGYGYNYDKLEGLGDGGAHMSSIVGRRFINGQCQYLVRNSWGKTACTKVVDEPDACSIKGHFWVNADDMVNSMRGISFVK